MASITLENVVTDFPIYGVDVSFRSALLSRAIGGLMRRQEDRKRIVVRALDNITLTLRDGDQLGIIGHNGAGKSTLLRVLSGIYEPSQGRIAINGRVSPLFLTAPGLDFDDTGYENIVTCGQYLGMSHAEIVRKIPDIEAFAELGNYLALPVRTYSSGMIVRLGFAIATAIDPEILLLDEGLGAGDARFADRAQQRVEAMVKRASIMVLASHSDALIRQMCNRAILLHHGRLIADGPTDDVLDHYARMNAETDGRVFSAPQEPFEAPRAANAA